MFKMAKNIPQQHRGKTIADIPDSPRVSSKTSGITFEWNQQGEPNVPGFGSLADTPGLDDDTSSLGLSHTGTLVPVSLVRSFYELSALDVNGQMLQFSRFEGRVTLVVNVASGDEHATREFTQMNEFASTYNSKGLVILAFPCNQFGSKEPWEDHEIPLCLSHVRPGRGFVPKFHLMSRCDVNGTRSHPVFEYLKQRLSAYNDEAPASVNMRNLKGRLLQSKSSPDIRWNFEKFLMGYNGKPIKRFSSRTPLKVLASEVDELLRRANIAMQSSNGKHGSSRIIHTYDPGQDSLEVCGNKTSAKGMNVL